MSQAYRQAGVDIEAGYEAVERMKSHVKRTERKGVMGALGGFGGMFDLSSLNLKEPVLISGTDGVGTKLRLAFETDQHDTIGVDAVAMCVNDIIAQGAEPLYFLDYLALGKADPEKIEQIVKGVADGCEKSGCALIGGETAEMPGLYDVDEYDIAGFAVGACEKSDIITGEDIQAGDVLLGLPSSGVHSNGFSLVRKIVEEAELDWNKVYEPFKRPLGEVLLTPTKIYVSAILALMEKVTIKGMAHITGGGFHENIPRMLPEGFGAEIELDTVPMPDVFPFLQSYGNLDLNEMYHVFNMGIGMVLTVNKEDARTVLETLKSIGEDGYELGTVNHSGELELKRGKM
ncbi:phosphoribosylformylglycinamidine cyclo-ligase [Halalkalibacillus sediminis]|uniref:Phosphoribosylformylglycinamidine cyclo-ligase n=1 Tax=Halalkalibacillus sediminis TaxID=2018042 RepID=A0A2I0QQE7_9BACI|nr:phosphoribosylformylglycinamidine cyclo-ligase [Halalkalibacillus sediminis]PKR76555.1 phosphoribosylformylglycinamidine cyclo-ligase [Halalkalibacillus sediminis]